MKRRGATAAYQAERKTKPDVQAAKAPEPAPTPPSVSQRKYIPSVADALKEYREAHAALSAPMVKRRPATPAVKQGPFGKRLPSISETAEPKEPPKPAPKMTTRSASVGFKAPVKMRKMSAPAFVEDASDAKEVGGDLNRTNTVTPTPEESDEDEEEEEEGEDDEGGDDEEEQGDDVNKETAVVSISRRLSNAAHALANKGYEN
jgi:hypothetical protein